MLDIALVCVLLTTAGCAERSPSETRAGPSDDGAVVCPPGTIHMTMTGEEIRLRPHFAHIEEFCVTRSSYEGPGRRHGPYLQRGPNGERLVEGQYVDGQKHGIWTRRSTSQTGEETWDRGVRKFSHGRKPEFGHFTGIDVGACVPQSLHFELPLGSAYYTVVGRASGACEVRAGGVKEMGQLGLQVCRFPSAMGRVPYQLGDRILFGAAERYCEQHPPSGVPLWQRP